MQLVATSSVSQRPSADVSLHTWLDWWLCSVQHPWYCTYCSSCWSISCLLILPNTCTLHAVCVLSNHHRQHVYNVQLATIKTLRRDAVFACPPMWQCDQCSSAGLSFSPELQSAHYTLSLATAPKAHSLMQVSSTQILSVTVQALVLKPRAQSQEYEPTSTVSVAYDCCRKRRSCHLSPSSSVFRKVHPPLSLPQMHQGQGMWHLPTAPARPQTPPRAGVRNRGRPCKRPF